VLHRALLALAVALALACVPTVVELVSAGREVATVARPSEPHTPKAALATEPLRQSPSVAATVNAIRRILVRFALAFALVATVFAAAAAVGRASRRTDRSPSRPGRARTAPATRAPPAFA
jgi:hypothetical protein